MNVIEEASHWFRKAHHDDCMAGFGLEGGPEFSDSVCFHCQQSAEKNLKGLLILHQLEFGRTHSLQLLLEILARKELIPNEMIHAAARLEPYSVSIRYPSDDADPTYDDAKIAEKDMQMVRDWVKETAGRLTDQLAVLFPSERQN